MTLQKTIVRPHYCSVPSEASARQRFRKNRTSCTDPGAGERERLTTFPTGKRMKPVKTDNILVTLIARLWVLLILTTLAVSAQATQFSLSVTNGTGGGDYTASSTVTIWANPYESPDPDKSSSEPIDANAPLRVFDRWVGDTDSLADAYAAQTTLLMPSGDVSVTAQYKDAPRWMAPRVMVYAPEPHAGVVFMFHGRGGCAECQFTKLENRTLVNDIVSRGHAVVALDSYDRVERVWDLNPSASDNVDMQRVVALRNDLIARGRISVDDPVYLLGVSNGGTFVSLLGQQAATELGFSVTAQALYISPGDSDAMATTEVPTFYALGENDTVINNSRAVTNFGSLLDRGVPARLLFNTPSPVHPNRFWGIEGLTQSDSQAIHAGLSAAGFLDADNYVVAEAFEDDNSDAEPESISGVPIEYANYLHEIDNLLAASAARHEFFSLANDQVLSFFENSVTVVDLVPVITEISPASGAPGTVVTIIGSNLIGINEVKFNGVAAQFQTNLEYKLFAVVPADATSGTITVGNAGGEGESPMNFTVIAKPEIYSFAPSSGPVGTEVFITGTALTGASIVRLGDIDTDFVVDSDTQIRATVPAGAVTGKFRLLTPGGIAVANGRFRVQ